MISARIEGRTGSGKGLAELYLKEAARSANVKIVVTERTVCNRELSVVLSGRMIDIKSLIESQNN